MTIMRRRQKRRGTQMEEEESQERKVIDIKRMVCRTLPMGTMQGKLSINPKSIPTGPIIKHMILEARKRLKVILEFVQQRQEAMREELSTKGYVMRWVTDDDDE
ncbi:hypothetical protein D1007_17383 [Hordeum vulgare]|nr:hypothetical protein D1007_17383 [Hordeum vulgare]